LSDLLTCVCQVAWCSGRAPKDEQYVVIKKRNRKVALPTGTYLYLAFLENCISSAIKNDAARQLNQNWMVTSAVFILAVALQTKCLLSSKFLRNLVSMLIYSLFFKLEQCYDRIHGKCCGECCGNMLLTDTCYWSPTDCIPPPGYVFESAEENYNLSS